MHQFVALDVETANRRYASICAVGAARFDGGRVSERFYQLIDPADDFERRNMQIHGISPADVAGQPTFAAAAPALAAFIDGGVVVHHGHFDRSAIGQAVARWQLPRPRWDWLDSAQVARRAWPDCAQRGFGLKALCQRLGLPLERHHDALHDAVAAGQVLLAAAESMGVDSLQRLDFALRRSPQRAAEYQRGLWRSHDLTLQGQVAVFSGGSRIIDPQRRSLVAAAQLRGCEFHRRPGKRTTLIICGEDEQRPIPPSCKQAQLISDAEFIALIHGRDD